MRMKKGQRDSEEEESTYEKERKKGDNDMSRKFIITLTTKTERKKSS